MRVTLCALVLLVAAEAMAAPAPLPKREKPPAYRWVEIDFSPMDTLAPEDGSWVLWTTLQYPDGGSFTFGIADNRSGRAMIAAREFCQAVSHWYRIPIAPCGKKCVLPMRWKSYRFLWLEFSLPGLLASAKPSVRWLR